MRHSNYDKYPTIDVPFSYAQDCWIGWVKVSSRLRQKIADRHSSKVIVAECYSGAFDKEISKQLDAATLLAFHSKLCTTLPRQYDTI